MACPWVKVNVIKMINKAKSANRKLQLRNNQTIQPCHLNGDQARLRMLFVTSSANAKCKHW